MTSIWDQKTASRRPAGLLGMLAVIALVELFVARHRLDLTSPATLTWALSGQAARTEARRCRVLCFGESLMKHGLLPAVLEGRLTGRVYNLSVCAAQAPTSYYLLKRAFDSGARPDAVVVDFAPDLLTGGPEYNGRNWPELLSWPETLDLAVSARDSGLFLTVALGKLLPSERTRHEVRALFSGWLHGQNVSPKQTNRLYTRQWTVNRGGQFTPPNPLFTGAVSEVQQTAIMSDRFWCGKINRRYIDRFLDLASSRGARVYWLLPPVSPAVQARRDASGADARLDAFLKQVQARHPRLSVLDARHCGYPSPVFQDARHLVAGGTLALSESVAEVIARNDRTPWISLPTYRPREPDPRLEDVNGSRIALEARSGTRK